MAQTKENLLKLLSLIQEISQTPGNEWFNDELKSRFIIDPPPNTPAAPGTSIDNNEIIGVISKNVHSIKKYLKIDVIPLIDYSDIKEARVREQLFRDCLEMGKYRLGKINDTINFDEFCRYAHLQGEELINYLFNKKYNNNIDAIIEALKLNSRYAPYQLPTNLNQIDYSSKLYALKKIVGLTYKNTSILLFLKDFRNELSHRNSLTQSLDDKILVQYIEKKLDKVKPMDYNALNIDEQEIYNKANYIKTKREQDFNKIYETLNNLKSAIVDTLNK